jgi:hypothetical protein
MGGWGTPSRPATANEDGIRDGRATYKHQAASAHLKLKLSLLSLGHAFQPSRAASGDEIETDGPHTDTWQHLLISRERTTSKRPSSLLPLSVAAFAYPRLGGDRRGGAIDSYVVRLRLVEYDARRAASATTSALYVVGLLL